MAQVHGVRGNNKIMLSEYKDQVYSEENTQRKSLRVTSNQTKFWSEKVKVQESPIYGPQNFEHCVPAKIPNIMHATPKSLDCQTGYHLSKTPKLEV